MTAPDIRDDNLRLILVKTERQHLCLQRSYHVQSLIYCMLVLAGFGLYMMLMPLLVLLFPDARTIVTVLGGVFGLVSFCSAVLIIPIFCKYLRYIRLIREHRKFLERYGRRII